jgi:hypothetical protein
VQGTLRGIDARLIGMGMSRGESFDGMRRLVSGNCRACDNAVNVPVMPVMGKCRGHWPGRFACDDRRAYSIVGKRATRERARNESYGIDGVHCRTENVVKIGSKPLKRTTQ